MSKKTKSKQLPDLGIYILNTYGAKTRYCCYGVAVNEITYIENDLYSFTRVYDGCLGSFDFTSKELDELIGIATDEGLKSFLESNLKKPFEDVHNISFEEAPIFVNFSAFLGDPDSSDLESFIPLKIVEFTPFAS